MTERVLLVGSGAREHAIAAALARSVPPATVLCFGSARNPGIAALAAAYEVGNINDPAEVTAFATTHAATLAIIGPEAPLAAGVADALWQAEIAVVGPTRDLAQIESSKSFARELMRDYGIEGSPYFARFTSMQAVDEALRTWAGRHVIKDDGLAGGKGVKVCGDHLHTHADSLAFCQELTDHGRPFLLEEKLEGEEFSLLSFCDGETLRHMPPVQDHKRAFEGDTGPNTGGMGTVTAPGNTLPFLQPGDITQAQRINEQVAAALRQRCGTGYRGILYGGFMATRDGVRVIEYNARFGDPECLNLLTLLASDFLAICRAITDGTLHQADVRFSTDASVCKYVVPEGYPEHSVRDEPVLLPANPASDTALYLGAVDERGGQLIATGSRTVAVVSRAPTLAQAEAAATRAAATIPGRFFFRRDIGTAAMMDRRVQHMQQLRQHEATTHAE